MSGWAGFVRRRLDGTNETDPWGLDVDLFALVAPWLARLPGTPPTEVPPDGPALVLTTRRLATAVGLLKATGRPVRVLGIPDVEPVATLLRRLGGAVAHPAEAAALLRAGHLVVGPPSLRLRDDMRVSDGWVTSEPDAVHLHGTRDPHPLRGGGPRRR